MRSVILVWIAVLVAGMPQLALKAQESPYVGFENRSIKALSDQQIDEYQQGHGMGFALAAELNGYPGPKHVLEMAERLGLTADQILELEAIFQRMQSSAVDLGTQIVDREDYLDGLFESGGIDEGLLRDELAEIAELQGELRAAHLIAHLETTRVLTGAQIQTYLELRGYESGETLDQNQHSGHHGR